VKRGTKGSVEERARRRREGGVVELSF